MHILLLNLEDALGVYGSSIQIYCDPQVLILHCEKIAQDFDKDLF